MGNNKVSEKAVWEGSITSDNDTPSMASQMHTQSQMMFCYKCNQVIPGNSTFCPYCQIKLFVECPKCNAKYSSQYPACYQCGTIREEYLQMQRIEIERKVVIERENRRQQELDEHKRLEEQRRKKEAEEEKERQKELMRRKAQEEIRREQELIITSQEFNDAYSYLCELIERKNKFNKEQDKRLFRRLKFIGLLFIIGLIFIKHLPEAIKLIVALLPFFSFLSFIGIKHIKDCKTLHQYCPQTRDFSNQLTQEIVDRVSKYIAHHDLNLNCGIFKDHIVKEIVKTYKAFKNRKSKNELSAKNVNN